VFRDAFTHSGKSLSVDDNYRCSKGLRSNSFTGSLAPRRRRPPRRPQHSLPCFMHPGAQRPWQLIRSPRRRGRAASAGLPGQAISPFANSRQRSASVFEASANKECQPERIRKKAAGSSRSRTVRSSRSRTVLSSPSRPESYSVNSCIHPIQPPRFRKLRGDMPFGELFGGRLLRSSLLAAVLCEHQQCQGLVPLSFWTTEARGASQSTTRLQR
jgi:hypothetical protein